MPEIQKTDAAGWQTIAAGIWIIVFLFLFFHQQLPNNPDFNRLDVWTLLLDEVLGTSADADTEAVDRPRSGWTYLPQRFPMLQAAALLLLCSWALGQLALRTVVPQHNLSRLEQLLIACGLGLSIQSLIVLAAGLAGMLSKTALLLPGISALIILCVMRFRSRAYTSTTPVHSTQDTLPHRRASRSNRLSAAISVLIATFMVLYGGYLLLGAMSPQTDFDVREYHLQGPKEWFQQGQITFLRHNVYTSFPFLSEMFSLAGMVLLGNWSDGALCGQLVLGTFALLTTGCVYCIARRVAGQSCGLLAALIHLTTPWTLRISIIAYAEGALTFYTAVSMLALIACGRFHPGDRNRLRFVAVTGFLSGSAMACKYTGLVTVVVPVGLILLFNERRRRSDASEQNLSEAVRTEQPPRYRSRLSSVLLAGLIFGCSALSAVAPWLLRNLADTGNPVYPLAWTVFGGHEWTPQMDARWKPAHAPSEHSLTQLPQHILDFSVRNDWTSGLLFSLGVPALLLVTRLRGAGSLACMIFWSFASWWALTHRIDRFWIPVIPLLAVMASFAWKLSSDRRWSAFLLSVVAACTLFNIRFSLTPLIGFHAGLMDLEAAEKMTVRSDLQLLNTTLPAGSRVLMVGEAEVFNAKFEVVYNTVFDENIFQLWTAAESGPPSDAMHQPMRPAAEIRAILAQHGITHVYVNWGEILRYRSPGSYGYPDYVMPNRFTQLVVDGVLQPPRTLLARPWSSYSDQQQKLIGEWPGSAALLESPDTFSGIQLFQVVSETKSP